MKSQWLSSHPHADGKLVDFRCFRAKHGGSILFNNYGCWGLSNAVKDK